jgi:adenosylcobinamide-GDP ribazoletransferase
MPVRSAVRAAAGAVTFLTIVPLGRLIELDESDVARGALFFPLVGAGIGAAVGLAAIALDDVLPVFAAAALVVALEALLTGVMHLDALADTADGLGAGTRERALEIMRDARIGSFGAVALVLDLLVKVAAVVAVVELERTILLLVAVWAVGRSAPLVLALFLTYARPDPGSGRTLTDGAGRVRLLLGIAVGIAFAIVAGGSRAPALLAAAATCVVLCGLVARTRFGGVTGDVLGASVEVTTTLTLVGAVATS